MINVQTNGTIKFWDAHTGECRITLTGHQNWVISAIFTHEGCSYPGEEFATCKDITLVE